MSGWVEDGGGLRGLRGALMTGVSSIALLTGIRFAKASGHPDWKFANVSAAFARDEKAMAELRAEHPGIEITVVANDRGLP